MSCVELPKYVEAQRAEYEAHKARQRRLGMGFRPTPVPAPLMPVVKLPPDVILPKVRMGALVLPSEPPALVSVIHAPTREERIAAAREKYKPVFPLARIQAIVAAYYNVPISRMKSVTRVRTAVYPRFVAMYLCNVVAKASLPAIGRAFGNRDHTTALNGVRRIAVLIEVDAGVRETIGRFTALIGVDAPGFVEGT